MADQKLQCTVVTPEKSIFDREATRVTVPAHDGEIGILPGHARFLARLGVGEIRVTHDGKTIRLFVEGGFVQVANDRVSVLADAACALQDIDVNEAAERVDSLRGTGRGEEFATAKHRHLVMKRVKDRFDSS